MARSWVETLGQILSELESLGVLDLGETQQVIFNMRMAWLDLAAVLKGVPVSRERAISRWLEQQSDTDSLVERMEKY